MLRPIDIQTKEFEHKIKGYNPDQVDDFLDKVIHDYEILIKENQSLKEKLEETEKKRLTVLFLRQEKQHQE